MTSEPGAVTAFDETARSDELKPYYDLMCTHIGTTDDISFKLLGLVPVMSGTGVFLLAFQGGSLGTYTTILITLIGMAITLGIAVWERRNIMRCVQLIKLAKRLEVRLPVRQFQSTGGEPTLFRIKLNKRLAESIIYSASVVAWLVPLLQLIERTN